MTLKIETESDGRTTWIRLSGRLRSEHLAELKAQLRGEEIALDLEGITLVDVEAVRFLNRCEAVGIRTVRESPYIRAWMLRERVQTA